MSLQLSPDDLGRLRELCKSDKTLYRKLFPPNFRVWAVCNVWDCARYWHVSLASTIDHVDGYVVLSGPYANNASVDSSIDRQMREVFHRWVPDDKLVEWRYEKIWPSHQEKRATGFDMPFYRPGDWLLIIDDDEILNVFGLSLKEYLWFYSGNLVSVLYGEDGKLAKHYAKRMGYPEALATPMDFNDFHEPESIKFKTRLIRWRPGIQFINNHWSIGAPDSDGVMRPIVGRVKMHDVKIHHEKGLKSLTEKMDILQYYNARILTEEDTQAPPEFGATGH